MGKLKKFKLDFAWLNSLVKLSLILISSSNSSSNQAFELEIQQNYIIKCLNLPKLSKQKKIVYSFYRTSSLAYD